MNLMRFENVIEELLHSRGSDAAAENRWATTDGGTPDEFFRSGKKISSSSQIRRGGAATEFSFVFSSAAGFDWRVAFRLSKHVRELDADDDAKHVIAHAQERSDASDERWRKQS